MANCANVAATLHDHLCRHDWHGYTQGPGRWGDGEGTCSVWVDGKEYKVNQGDRDCSSSVINCWRVALADTPWAGRLDGTTFTGNMRSLFLGTGLFEWHPMGDGYIAQRGDIYLQDTTYENQMDHTAMCQSAIPDMMSEFVINEHGNIVGGQVGDQTGRESLVRPYADFPWAGILAYNGLADTCTAGWRQNATGWWFDDGNGGYPASTWKEIDGHWYYFDAAGYAATGWQYVKGEWYYLTPEKVGNNPECSMLTGWVMINSKWYYFKESGAMVSGCTMKIGKKTYAFSSSGAMIEGSVSVAKDGALVLD